MNWIRLTILLLLLHAMTPDSRSQLYNLLGDENSIEIPFRYEANFIIVKVHLNGTLPLNFIFDTGAEHTLLFKKTFTDILGIPYDKPIKIYGSNLEQYVNAYIVRNVKMKVPPLPNVRMDFLVMEEDYLQMDELIGLNVDGILGAQFFRHHVVKIDYRKGVITLYNRNAFKEPGSKYIPYPVSLDRHKPYVTARSHFNQIDSAELTLLLDTGASIGLMLHANTSERIAIPDNYIETNLGLGISGEITGYIGRVEQFNLSSFTFTNVIAGFQEIVLDSIRGPRYKRNGIIGNQILSRFTIIIDYPNSIIYLKPEKKFKRSFDYDKSGLILSATGPYLNHFSVISVLDNSPAGEADIRRGDEILKVNGIPAKFYSLSNLTRVLRKKEGKTIRLVLNRDGDKIKRIFELRKLL